MKFQENLQIYITKKKRLQTFGYMNTMFKQQTYGQRKERIEMQKKLYDTILEFQNEQVIQSPVMRQNAALTVHFLFKIVPLILVVFDEITGIFFEEQYTSEMIIVTIAIQFWITKNYTGKKMLGYKWFFGEDPYGNERLMFQCRANSQLIDQTMPRLFWIIQFMYVIISWLLFIEAVFIIPNAVRIESRKIETNLLIIGSGVANIFLFYSVSNSSCQIQQSLRRQLGIDYVKKLGTGTIIGYH